MQLTMPAAGSAHRRAVRAMVPAAVLIATIAACGGADATTEPSSTTTGVDTTSEPVSGPAGDPIALPEDPSTPVVAIGAEEIVITADGTVYRRTRPEPQGFGSMSPTAAESAAAPPADPAPAAYETARLTEAGLVRVFATAEELGLVATPPDYGEPGITDQGTFTVVVTTADAEHRHSVYAPGERTGDDDADDARDRLDSFVDQMRDLEGRFDEELSAFEPYAPERWRVDLDAYVSTAEVRPWPLPELPSQGCTTFAPDEFADPADGGREGPDPVSGVYETEQDDEIVVAPVMPWQECA